MKPEGAGEDRVNIHRFRANYFLSTQHAEPPKVAARLNDAVEKTLPGVLGAMLSKGGSMDDSVWLIKNLELQLNVNAAWEREELAQRWAAQIMHTLLPELQGSGDGSNVLWFADRSAYLSRFIFDLAAGQAWDKWYYKTFDGLRLLPASSAIRTVLCDEPASGLTALIRLSMADLDKILHALSVSDIRRVFFALAQAAVQTPDESSCLQAVWIVYQSTDYRLLVDVSVAMDEDREAFRLFIAVCRDHNELAGTNLKAAVQALLRFILRLGSIAKSQRHLLVAGMAQQSVAELYSMAAQHGFNLELGDVELLMPIMRCRREVWDQISNELLAYFENDQPAGKTSDSCYTNHGGAFLLLPLLDELKIDHVMQDWPAVGKVKAGNWVRFLVLMKCLGRLRAQRICSDPLLREIMAIDYSLDAEESRLWMDRISLQQADELRQQGLSRLWHDVDAFASPVLVLANVCLNLEDSVPYNKKRSVAVLIDAKDGRWLWMKTMDNGNPNAVLQELSSEIVALASNNGNVKLICAESLQAELVAAITAELPLFVQIYRQKEFEAELTEEVHNPSREVLARLGKLMEEFDYLSMPASLCPVPHLDSALTVLAQNILRRFARRLPGFAFSSLPYLYANFLDFPAYLEKEPAGYIVQLGRPPLALILNITGINRSRYSLSWPAGKTFALFQQDV